MTRLPASSCDVQQTTWRWGEGDAPSVKLLLCSVPSQWLKSDTEPRRDPSCTSGDKLPIAPVFAEIHAC